MDASLAHFVLHPAAYWDKLSKMIPINEAAFFNPPTVAVHSCHRGNIRPGQSVLIKGAGPIGLVCMLVAKESGASNVVILDFDTDRLRVAKELGADRVIVSHVENDPRITAEGMEVDVSIDTTRVESCIPLVDEPSPSTENTVTIEKAIMTELQPSINNSNDSDDLDSTSDHIVETAVEMSATVQKPTTDEDAIADDGSPDSPPAIDASTEMGNSVSIVCPPTTGESEIVESGPLLPKHPAFRKSKDEDVFRAVSEALADFDENEAADDADVEILFADDVMNNAEPPGSIMTSSSTTNENKIDALLVAEMFLNASAAEECDEKISAEALAQVAERQDREEESPRELPPIVSGIEPRTPSLENISIQEEVISKTQTTVDSAQPEMEVDESTLPPSEVDCAVSLQDGATGSSDTPSENSATLATTSPKEESSNAHACRPTNGELTPEPNRVRPEVGKLSPVTPMPDIDRFKPPVPEANMSTASTTVPCVESIPRAAIDVSPRLQVENSPKTPVQDVSPRAAEAKSPRTPAQERLLPAPGSRYHDRPNRLVMVARGMTSETRSRPTSRENSPKRGGTRRGSLPSLPERMQMASQNAGRSNERTPWLPRVANLVNMSRRSPKFGHDDLNPPNIPGSTDRAPDRADSSRTRGPRVGPLARFGRGARAGMNLSPQSVGNARDGGLASPSNSERGGSIAISTGDRRTDRLPKAGLRGMALLRRSLSLSQEGGAPSFASGRLPGVDYVNGGPRGKQVDRRSSLSVGDLAKQKGSGSGRKVTVPKPFALTGEGLQEKTMAAMEESRRKTLEMETRRRVFVAKPMPDFSKPSPPPKM